MIGKQLIEGVYEEAARLRQFAKKSELAKLDFDDLRPEVKTLCIYGSMTGNCDSLRSVELLKKCATIAVASDDFNGEISCHFEPTLLEDIFIRSSYSDKYDYNYEEKYAYSAIETYIVQVGADHKALIDYLKGESDTLDLSHTINC
jgi:hypothetical protein